MKLFQLRQ
jgi:hypothetical protein